LRCYLPTPHPQEVPEGPGNGNQWYCFTQINGAVPAAFHRHQACCQICISRKLAHQC
jgi:hypothetical protein